MLKKLLFKLHLRNTYPTYLTGLDGSKVPCTMIRTDMHSSDIRPDLSKVRTPYVASDSAPDEVYSTATPPGVIRIGTDQAKVNGETIHFDVYTKPGDQDIHLKDAHKT